MTEPGARPERLGMRISTGGSKEAPPGCMVQAKGAAAPSGSGIGISSKCTWLIETTVPSGAGAPSIDMEPAAMRSSRPSMPAMVSRVSSLVL